VIGTAQSDEILKGKKKRDAPNEDFTEPLADRFARKPAVAP
jgi:hypothetical protein